MKRTKKQAKRAFCETNATIACNVLEHFHLKHTSEKVTHFSAPTGHVEIYIVSDEESRKKFFDLFLEELPSSEAIN